MKHIILCFFLLTGFLSRADYWDNLTHSEAEQVVRELEANPFIFRYCDCCGHMLELVEVLSTEIVPCSWLEGSYSVRYTFKAIAQFERDSKDSAPEHAQRYQPEENSDLIYMNYTWTLDRESGKAAAYFKAIPYDYYDNQACSEPFDYPSPKSIKSFIKGTGYKKWYFSAIGK